jgi:hypothetical protein
LAAAGYPGLHLAGGLAPLERYSVMATVSFVAMMLVPVPLEGPQLDPRLEPPVRVTVRPITWVHPLLGEFPVNVTSDAGM